MTIRAQLAKNLGDARRPRARSGGGARARDLWIFLALRGATRKLRESPAPQRLDSLEFLGFSRPNRDFSMGCAGSRDRKNFLGAPSQRRLDPLRARSP